MKPADLAELLRLLPELREVVGTLRELGEVGDLVRTLRELVELLRAGGLGAKKKKLVGWKALVEVSVAHGGPGSENKLRDLCRKRGAPVHVWRGMAAIADEDRFVVWLEGLRVPIGLEPVGGGGKGWSRGRKNPKNRRQASP